MNISIIIVNYNTSEYLINCIDSIINFTKAVGYEIIVVDNNSDELNIKNLPLRFPVVRFFFLKKNIGFSAACNYGASQSHSDFLAFVNPDIVLTSNVFYSICINMTQNLGLGVCAPMLISPDYSYQNSTGSKMGFFFEFLEAFWLIGFYRKLQKIAYRGKFKVSKPIKVSWVSGAFMVVRREIFEKVNAFDEDYFLNYEDIDLCSKIEKTGFKNYFYPDLKCIHVGSVSQRKNFESLVLNRYKSRLTYSKKHYSPVGRIGVRCMHAVGLFLRIAVLYFKQKNVENKQRLSGYEKSLMIYLGKDLNNS
jgi:GT2 family glycosyltransferase